MPVKTTTLTFSALLSEDDKAACTVRFAIPTSSYLLTLSLCVIVYVNGYFFDHNYVYATSQYNLPYIRHKLYSIEYTKLMLNRKAYQVDEDRS
jgi:hypothetical protein